MTTTTLRDSTLTATGKVFIIGTLNSTLNNSILISNMTGNYNANLYINKYLRGKGLTSYSQDYRYYLYYTGINLQTALTQMPNWYLIMKAPLWA